MRVLFLARLRDCGNFYSSWVNQLFISFDAASSWTLDINAANRDFDQFLRNYVGLDSLLPKVLGQEEGE